MKSHIIAAKREAAHRRDDRLANTRHRVPARQKIAQKRVGEVLFAHFFNVGAGGEGLFGAGQHDAADFFVRLERLKGVVEFADQLRVERIERVRPMQTNEPRFAVPFDLYRLVAHARISSHLPDRASILRPWRLYMSKSPPASCLSPKPRATALACKSSSDILSNRSKTQASICSRTGVSAASSDASLRRAHTSSSSLSARSATRTISAAVKRRRSRASS
jgi:hypothetical protein